tara:strand:+ start:402 stop:1154 length:753 start_codon:yes stop_codon:yes gene_type:complete
MKVLDKVTSIILFPIYYTIHHNIFFGLIHKIFIKKFYYKEFVFNLINYDIPLANYSSFLFKTYEYNDKKLVEQNIDTKNKCIIIGGGLGFIATIAYHRSKNKVLVFEINKQIIINLIENLKLNNCKFSVIEENLTLDKKVEYENFYLNKDFLASSKYLKTPNLQKTKNITKNEIIDFNDYNTIIIDGEGIEEHFINNLDKIPNIKHIFFEFHHNIFNEDVKKDLFLVLTSHKFEFVSKCFNSYYFQKNKY